MYLYVIFILLAAFSFFEVFGKKKGAVKSLPRCLLIFSILSLFILSAIRWERGTDWDAYLQFFNTTKRLDFSNHFENGFIFLNHAVKSIFDDYTTLLIIEGLILYVFLYKSIKSIAVYPIFSLFCYFATMKGGIFFVRQTVVVSILLFSLKYIVDRKLLKFLILVLLAASIHRSCWLFLPCYWLYLIKLNFKYYIFIICVSIIIGGALLTLLNGITLGTGNPYVDAKLNGYLSSGMDGEMYGVNMSKETMLIRGIGKRLIFLILIVLFLWRKIQLDKMPRGLFNIYFCGICLYIVLAPISIDFARSVLPFDLMDIYLLPMIVENQKLPFNKGILFSLILVLSLSRLHSSINLRSELFVPYKSIFNKELKVEKY